MAYGNFSFILNTFKVNPIIYLLFISKKICSNLTTNYCLRLSSPVRCLTRSKLWPFSALKCPNSAKNRRTVGGNNFEFIWQPKSIFCWEPLHRLNKKLQNFLMSFWCVSVHSLWIENCLVKTIYNWTFEWRVNWQICQSFSTKFPSTGVK